MIRTYTITAIAMLAACSSSGTTPDAQAPVPSGATVTPDVTPPMLSAAEPTSDTLTIQTPTGPVEGILVLPGGNEPVPVLLLHVGSGPTMRDGETAAGPDNYFRQLADSLVKRGVGTLRYDKRGFGASSASRIPEQDLRFGMLVDDAAEWVRNLRADSRVGRVLYAGHSEGALVTALAQHQEPADAYISIAGAGRRADIVVREQLARQLPEPMLVQVDSIFAALLRGETVDDTPPMLAALFRPSVQPYLISWLPHDPAEIVSRMQVPVLVVQGSADIQVSEADARLLANSNPRATLALIQGMNHVLKTPEPGAVNMGYNSPELAISSELVDVLARFALEK
ncbi:MAG TPA: alpha/beta fold hydrolase [Gemmatimonadales bacterium]|nr:alpha/beta fold hydrolase [Gemmatimonadales bacterium]